MAAIVTCDEALATFRHANEVVPPYRGEARSDIEKAMGEARATCRS